MPPQSPNVPNIPESEMKMPGDDASTPASAPARHHFLLIIVILLIVLAAVLAGLFLWQQRVSEPAPLPDATRPTAEENNEPESTTAEAITDTNLVVSPSTELSAIEADLEATQFGDIEADLSTIDSLIE